MLVKLKPVMRNGVRTNTGKVGIVLKVSDSGLPIRTYIGDEPVDVTGCKCPVLAGCLKDGKLIEVKDAPAERTPPQAKKQTSARAPSKE